MPAIVDYQQVYQRLTAQGLVCNYPQSGAFAFLRGTEVHVAGWIGQDDPTVRPAVRAMVRVVSPPVPPSLAGLLVRAWQEQSAAPAWLMPMSHWAYEFEFARPELQGVLDRAGVDTTPLRGRADGSAVAFDRGESGGLLAAVQGLLEQPADSDFMLAFPGEALLCMVHHHVQLWWMCRDAALAGRLRALAEGNLGGS